MYFESLFVKIGPHIFKMLIQIIMDQLKRLVRIDPLFRLLPAPSYGKRRERLFYLTIVTDGTGDDAGRLLLLKGGIVLEPTLKFMTL